MDPITIIMFALIAVMVIFMFRNGKKRQNAMQDLQSKMLPGAEVMLQSGIFGTIESIDEENLRATIATGTSTIEVHRNAISQVVTPVDAPEEEPESGSVAPDDDPEFGERVANADASQSDDSKQNDADDEAPKA